MSLLGVNNINQLTECTVALPPFLRGFLAPDQPEMEKFLNGPYNPTTAEDLLKGDRIKGFPKQR